MFPSFRHKRPQKEHTENDAQDKIANSIAHKCMKAQERCATYMQRQTERLSFKTKKLLLLIFFLLSSGCSLYLIVESLISHQNKSFSITLIKVPEHIDKTGNENTKAPVIVSEAEYERIHRFQLHMDSLAKNLSGKRLYDSILLSRPHLMDSIMIIQEMYKSKKQEKDY